MKLDFSQNQSQRQQMNQKQLESLSLLSMNNCELKDFLYREQQENPFLELGDSGRYEQFVSIGRWMEESGAGQTGEEPSSWDEDEATYDIADKDEETILEQLRAQVGIHEFTEKEAEIFDFLLNSLDEAGYLNLSPAEIGKMLKADCGQVRHCIRVLKSLDPPGVGARDLKECLKLQLERLPCTDPLCVRVAERWLEDIAAGRLKRAAETEGVSTERIRDCLKVIRNLNPKPFNGYQDTSTQYIVPDIVVKKENGELKLHLNDGWIGSVGISTIYQKMAAEGLQESEKAYFSRQLHRARFILTCIEQRRETILKIARYVAEQQSGFLEGKGNIRPLTMKQAALALGIHESTVSRAVKDKYLGCPKGCFLMKGFFMAAAGTAEENGERGQAGREELKERIRLLIEGEDKKKPYSDSTLAELLKGQGNSLSRRTVAKYREELNIMGTFERKE